MNEYKINATQFSEIIELIENGFECDHVEEYQGYMSVHVQKRNHDYPADDDKGWIDVRYDFDCV